MSDSKQPNKSTTTPGEKPTRTSKRKGRKQSAEARLNVSLRKHIRKLRRDLEARDAVLQLYADHRNWVKPEEVRARLSIPETDRSGKTIDAPCQCFVGARYPWEPALKLLIGMAEEQESSETDPA
ncbi:MAG: hypothetical protein WC423_20490 [Vulcanimicrobiota bacterium]